MLHIFLQSKNKIIKWNVIPLEWEPIIDLERTIAFIFHFFLNVEPIVPSKGRLIIIKNVLTSRRTEIV